MGPVGPNYARGGQFSGEARGNFRIRGRREGSWAPSGTDLGRSRGEAGALSKKGGPVTHILRARPQEGSATPNRFLFALDSEPWESRERKSPGRGGNRFRKNQYWPWLAHVGDPPASPLTVTGEATPEHAGPHITRAIFEGGTIISKALDDLNEVHQPSRASRYEPSRPR